MVYVAKQQWQKVATTVVALTNGSLTKDWQCSWCLIGLQLHDARNAGQGSRAQQPVYMKRQLL